MRPCRGIGLPAAALAAGALACEPAVANGWVPSARMLGMSLGQLLVAEGCVFALEGLIYALLLKVSAKAAFRSSLAANIASLLASLLLVLPLTGLWQPSDSVAAQEVALFLVGLAANLLVEVPIVLRLAGVPSDAQADDVHSVRPRVAVRRWVPGSPAFVIVMANVISYAWMTLPYQ